MITEAGVASGQLLGERYRLGELIGRGSTAEVFRARDELLERDVAVKVFRDLHSGDDAMYGAARRETELASLATLNHPHLIRLFDGSVSDDGPAFLVLDLVCGADLATRLHDGPLPEEQVRLIGRQIADGLDYAHAHGMVHRDVKPANILLGDDGHGGTVWARLSDFGTVRMVDRARLTAADLTLGTASYIAPEQARGLDVGPEADVYALGLVLIEALTGERCFADTTPDGLAARLALTPPVPKWAPEDLRTLFTAMTAPEPDRRPTAAAVVEALRGSLPAAVAAAADAEATTSLRAVPVDADGPEPPVVIPAEAAPARQPRRHSNALFALAALAFGAMVSGAAFLIINSSAASTDDTPSGPQAPPPASGRQHPHTRAASHVATQPAALDPATSARASASATHSRGPVLAPRMHLTTEQAAAPSTSAAPSTAAPTTSAPAPSTSATPSPSDTPSTSAPASSADTSTAAAPAVTG